MDEWSSRICSICASLFLCHDIDDDGMIADINHDYITVLDDMICNPFELWFSDTKILLSFDPDAFFNLF